MQLRKIKLSGFKSFVDVATVPIDKNLVGIVGPNGCGKSNVIDAVKWVMGESSAKQLRGDSMTDVIFNGTSTRKPVSQASIELVFDNTISPLTGQYAKYTEIAIKRVINREGLSTYYLNNSKCRRKDLSDLFMGTGLGPRSYSIIEQGMISRIIEAKPEDLRVYLEEAAGISKYKERRRETEIRIKHAKENLDRVNDIRVELGKQIEKLAKQAETAEQYKLLKQDLTNQEQYQLALQYNNFNAEYKEVTDQVNQKGLEIEEYNAKIESNNTIQEHKKIAVNKLQHRLQEEQAKFYKIEQSISNLEQEIKHQQSEKAHTENNLKSTDKQIEYCINNLENKNIDLNNVNNNLASLEPEFEELKAQRDIKKESLKSTEELLSSWEKEWQQQQEHFNDNGKAINQSQALIEKHETLVVRSQKRIEILQKEQQQLKLESKDHNISELRNKQIEFINVQEEKQLNLETITESCEVYKQDIENISDELNELNNEFQAKKGRLSSLKTLQEHALGKDQKNLNKWLEQNNLDKSKRLGEIINIESGWEKSLETILRDYIKAIVLPEDTSINSLDLLDQDLAKLNTAFISTNKDLANNREDFVKNKNLDGLDLLVNKIKAPIEISHLVNNIYCAENIEQAKENINHLKYYESIITKDGLWLNNNWFTRINELNNKQDSILSRESEINDLNSEIEDFENKIDCQKQNLAIKKAELEEYSSNREDLQRDIRDIINNLSEVKSEISKKETRLEQQRNRLFQVEQDLSEAIKHVEVDSAAIKIERSKLESAMFAMEDLTGFKNQLQTQGEELKQQVKSARSDYDSIKDSIHKAELTLQKLRQQSKHVSDEINRLNKQQDKLSREKEELLIKIDTFDQPIVNLREELDNLLDSKQEQSSNLSHINQEHESALQDLNVIEKEIIEIRKSHDSLRDVIESLKIKQHEVNTRLNAIKEAIAEKELVVDDLISNIPTDINLNQVKNKIRDLKQQVDSLGAVNLTAIEEYQIESERKTYLDTQEADLQEALAALEDAIMQIDEETKARFKETFDFVNEQFQYLFPKVFGGGKASLILSSDDLLDTGITVMAQPPGKRNATIHLLSGGEKALTAIAMVFSIFRLNPAPFCMLDEVDAPLDEANVNRYCNLVKEMSRDVQFIFITHNKVTMSMAEHLIGVTQNEPGASRLVAVDLEQAASLAEA